LVIQPTVFAYVCATFFSGSPDYCIFLKALPKQTHSEQIRHFTNFRHFTGFRHFTSFRYFTGFRHFTSFRHFTGFRRFTSFRHFTGFRRFTSFRYFTSFITSNRMSEIFLPLKAISLRYYRSIEPEIFLGFKNK
jgi:hypothetical protein